MIATMRVLMGLMGRLGRRTPHADPATLRSEMSRSDPEFRRVREVQHEALQALTAKRLQDGLAIRREREFWRHGGHQGES